MQTTLAIALFGLSAGAPAPPAGNISLTGQYLEGEWAPANNPRACEAANGPKFLPDQKIPTPTGDTIGYSVLPGGKGISFIDFDGQKIAYLIKVLSENEFELEVTYDGLTAEFDEPVIHRRCPKA